MTYFHDEKSEWVPLYDPDEDGVSAEREIIGYIRDFLQYGRVTVSNRRDTSGRFAVRHADPGSDQFIIIREAAGDTPEAGMMTVTQWANHSMEMAALGRCSMIGVKHTPWGPVGHVIDYGDGLERAFSAQGSGYHLTEDLINRLPSAVRQMSVGEDGSWFPDDLAGPHIICALPEFFTTLELCSANEVVGQSYVYGARSDTGNRVREIKQDREGISL